MLLRYLSKHHAIGITKMPFMHAAMLEAPPEKSGGKNGRGDVKIQVGYGSDLIHGA